MNIAKYGSFRGSDIVDHVTPSAKSGEKPYINVQLVLLSIRETAL